MKLSEVFKNLHSVKGASSMIAGVMSGNLDPIRGEKVADETVEQAEKNLESARDAQRNCKSDWAYWGYMGDIAYWEMITNLLKAARITGPDNLPEVKLPGQHGVVMDVYSNQMNFGKEVLRLAEATRNVHCTTTEEK